MQLLANRGQSLIIASYHVAEPRTNWAALGARFDEALQGGRADVIKVVAKAETIDDGMHSKSRGDHEAGLLG
jgi:3-dehydroquinate dehydratase